MGIWAWEHPDKSEYVFVVDTDSYAGNFERELSSFVVGRCDEFGDHRGNPYKELYTKELPADPFDGLIGSRVCDPGDDGIHRAPMDLAPTPGYSNDGRGNVKKLKPGQKLKYGAFNSVAIFLRRKPTKAELSLLVKRARAFETLPKTKEWEARPKILGCRLVEERLLLVSTDL